MDRNDPLPKATCVACKHCHAQRPGDMGAMAVYDCRRHPPQSHAVIRMMPNGEPDVVNWTAYPAFHRGHDICGEFVTKISN